jgi:hypothetical protein
MVNLENIKYVGNIPCKNPKEKIKFAIFGRNKEFLGYKVDMFWGISKKGHFKYHIPEKALDLVEGLVWELNENSLTYGEDSEYKIAVLKATSELSEENFLNTYVIRKQEGKYELVETE